jgi:hypothetical protein
VEVRIGEDLRSRATGLTKKIASQRAARLLLDQLQPPGAIIAEIAAAPVE